MALSVFHAFKLETIRIEKEHGIIVVIIFAGWIDDGGAKLVQEVLQRIHVSAAAQLEGIVVEADVADAVFAFATVRIGGADPESCLAIGPADRILVFLGYFKAKEAEQPVIE